MEIMLFFHPVIQILTNLLALYVLFLGIQRTRSLHLKKGGIFKWKMHVRLGLIVMAAWVGGLLGAVTIVYIYWRRFMITGMHGRVALIMLPFIVFGLFTGIYMDRIKKKRKLLPLVHGMSNCILLLLAQSQIITGWGIYINFIR